MVRESDCRLMIEAASGDQRSRAVVVLIVEKFCRAIFAVCWELGVVGSRGWLAPDVLIPTTN